MRVKITYRSGRSEEYSSLLLVLVDKPSDPVRIDLWDSTLEEIHKARRMIPDGVVMVHN